MGRLIRVARQRWVRLWTKLKDCGISEWPMADRNPRNTVGPCKQTIEFVHPESATTFEASNTSPVAKDLRFGLFDNFIEVQPGGGAKPLHGRVEKDNFVGADSRRFYIRVTDANAKGRPFVECEWWTQFDDVLPGDPSSPRLDDTPKSILTLLPVAPGSSTFVSRGLMLVGNSGDRQIETNSGLTTTVHPKVTTRVGRRTDTESDYRIRRAGMFGFGVAKYPARIADSAAAFTATPVFRKTRTMPLQIYVLESGGNPVLPLKDVARDLVAIRRIFSTFAIWPWATLSAQDGRLGTYVTEKTIDADGVPYTIGLVAPSPGINPRAIDTATRDKLALAHPERDPHTLRLFYIGQFHASYLHSSVLGVAEGVPPDPFPPPGATTSPPPAHLRGMCLVRSARGDHLTAAHELGHQLTRKSELVKATTPLGAPTFVEVSHYRVANFGGERRIAPLNLMNSSGDKTAKSIKPFRVLHPVRLWTNSDQDHHTQSINIELSPFLR